MAKDKATPQSIAFLFDSSARSLPGRYGGSFDRNFLEALKLADRAGNLVRYCS